MPEDQHDQPPEEPVLDPAAERALSESLERLFGMKKATSGASRELLGSQVDVVDDPSAALRLSRRHNAVRITDALVSNIMRYIRDGDRSGLDEDIDVTMRKHVRQHGFFLEYYDEAKMADRIGGRYADGRRKYIIAETSVPDDRGALVPCADAQFSLPVADEHATSVIELPTEGDPIMNPGLVATLRAMPFAVASLEDLVCEPSHERVKAASSALKRGLHDIVTIENPLRGKHRIRYVTACLASVQGLVLASETDNDVEWMLQEDGGIPPMYNERGSEVFEHLGTNNLCTRFRTAFVLHNRRIALTGVPGVRALLVDWHTKVADLKES